VLVRYDPYTQCVQVLDRPKAIHGVIEEVKDQLNSMYTVLEEVVCHKEDVRYGQEQQHPVSVMTNGAV